MILAIKELNNSIKKANIKGYFIRKRENSKRQYLALIAGFMIFAPFSDSFIKEASIALKLDESSSTGQYEKSTILEAKTGIPLKYKKISTSRTYERVITAYSSVPEETDDTPFITASGSYVRFGVVAANWLPIGTAVRIPEFFGKQVFIVEDRMNKRHDDKLDVWFPTKEAAINFGKRVAKIEVI